MFGLKGFGGGKRNGDGMIPAGESPAGEAAPGSSSANSSAAVAQSDTDVNRLVVGPGLTFDGAIATCDHLMVGGRVVSDVEQCQRLEIAPGGSFQGSVTVTDADIAGYYEGELKVLGDLRIRATGHVKGRITYGTLAIEPGGNLLGIIDSLSETRQQTRPVVVAFRPRRPSATAPAASITDNDGNG